MKVALWFQTKIQSHKIVCSSAQAFGTFNFQFNFKGLVSLKKRVGMQWISVFSPNAGKYGPEKTPYLDTFNTVCDR